MPQAVEVIQGGQTRTVEFPDEMSRAEIEAALRQQFPSAVPSEVDRTFSGYVGEIPRGLARGVVGIGESIATGLSSLLPEEQEQEARDKITEVGQDFREPFRPKAGYEESLVGRLSEGVGSTAPFLLTGPLGAVRGTAAALGLGAAAQSGEAVTRAVAEGATEEQIDKAAALGVIPGLTEGAVPFAISRNFLALRKALGDGAANSLVQGLKRVAVSAGSEGLQEASSEIAQNLIAQNIYSPETGTFTNTGEAFGLGAGVGGIIQGLFELALPRNRASSFTPTSDPTQDQPGDLPTTADLSEITQETITPDLAATEPTPDISAETLRTQTEEKLALIAPKLRGVLKGRGLDDIGINLSYQLDPEVLARTRDPDDVNALFDPATRSILLAADRVKGFEQMDAPQLQTQFAGLVDHEMVHGAKQFGLWTDAEWSVLENAARRRTNSDGQTYMDAAQETYTKESPEIQREEAVAELVRETFGGRTGLAGQPLSLMQRLVEFFRKMGNALTGTGYASFNQVVNDIDTGVLGARPRGGTQATPVATPMIVGSPALASRQALGRDRSPMGINVRQDPDGTDYASLIASGQKTYESRESRSLDPYVGKRVDLVRTGAGPAAVVGSAEVGTPIEVDETQFANMRGDHLVAEGSAFDIKRGKTKFLYPMTNAESTEPTVLPSEYRGIVARKTGEPLASRRLKSDVQAQQQLPLPEGMTGAEVAAEELRVAEQTRMQEQARAGVGEARSILEDDQQPLASRGRLDRAKEQGFDTENILYHGTASDIKEFDPSKFGDTTKANSARLGAWLVSDPEVASGYARYAAEDAPVQKLIEESDAAGRAGNFDLQEQLTIQAEDLELGRSLVDAGGQNVVPLVVKGSLFEVDAEGQTLADLDDGQLVTWAQEAKNNGLDGLKIKNFSDNIDWGNYVSADHYLIFDPENIRSVNAEFDSDQTESPRLLASRKLKTKPEDSAALAEDKSKGATEVRGNPEADRAAADELRKVKTLASRAKPSDIVESTAYSRVADVASARASRGQGNINNALPFEAPSSADDRGIVFQMQDKLIDLKNTEKAIKDNQRQHGLTLLKDSKSPYLGEESMHGIIGNKFNRFQEDEVKPLAEKLTGRNITRQELEEFLVLRHAIERNAHVRKLNAESKEPRADLQDGGAGSLNGERLLDDYVKQQMRSQYGLTWNDSTQSWEGGNRKAAVMNDLAGDFDAITRGTLQELKDSGLINQDSLDKLQGYYKYYAPLRGVSPDEDVAIEEHARISKSSNNLSIKGVETERTKGRVSEASPPLGQIIFQRQNAIKRGTINDVVGQRMLNLIRENPNDNYWKIHTDSKYADITGLELLGVKEDGKQYFVEFKDPRLRQAMMSLDAGQMSKGLAMLRGVNRYLSAVMTSYNPGFIAPNFTRDITAAISNLVGEQNAVDGKALNTDGLIGAVVRDVGPSVREVYRGLRGKKLNKKLAQDWKDYLESGAKTEWFHVRSPDESARDIDDLIAMSQGTFKGNMKAGKDAIAGWVSDLNGAIENGVRFATFKNARDAFIKNGDSQKEALAKAASLAKNLTVNFNRKGNSGEKINALYLFFNASVQGTANFLRNLTSPAKQRLLGSMASLGALTAWLNEMVSEEDDDGRTYYANIEPYVKERNLVIMKTINPFYDGHPKGVYTIPLPYGYNTLHVLGVNTAEAAMGLIDPQDAAARLVSTALGSFSPVGFGTSENPGYWAAKGLTPQIGKPIMEILLNEDFFGSPVYTTPFDFGPQIPVANLSQRSTPEAFKQTTRFLNRLPLLGPGTGGDESKSGPLGWISPDALDHYFGSMIGGTGMFAERTGRLVGESADYFQETDGPMSLDDFFEQQDLTVSDIPILRRFNHESRGFITQSRYYDRKEDIMLADRQVDILRGAERGEYIRENRPLLQMKRGMDSSDKRLRNINRRLARIGEQILTATSLEATIRLEEEQHRLEELKRGVYNRFNKLFDDRVGVTK